MMTCNLHHVASVKADQASGTSWLEIACKDGSCAIVFMPYDQAAAMVEALNRTARKATEDAA